jgi:hypothetical protein
MITKKTLLSILIVFLIPAINILFSLPTIAADKNIKSESIGHNPKKHKANSNQAINVKIYAIMDRIYDISISDRSYKAEAEVLLKWRPSADDQNTISALKERHYSGQHAQDILDKIWHPEFLIKSELSRREVLFKTVTINSDGSIELFEKLHAYLPINSEMTSYPFGTLELSLDIVAYKDDFTTMVFDPIDFSIGHGHDSNNVIVGNWSKLEKKMNLTLDNRLSSQDDKYSKIQYQIILKHDFLDSMQKIFIPILGVLFISLMLNLFSSMRFKENIDMRVMGQISLLLTTFALKFTLTDEIPSTHYLTLIDYLFIITTIIVIFNLLISVIISEYYLTEVSVRIRKIEKTIDYSAPLITLGILIGIFNHFLN